MISSKPLSIISKLLIFLCAGTGVALSLGILTGFNQLHTLNFFTILSSALVAISYPFLDPNVNGMGGVITMSTILTASFMAIGYLLFGLDKLLAKINKKQ